MPVAWRVALCFFGARTTFALHVQEQRMTLHFRQTLPAAMAILFGAAAAFAQTEDGAQIRSGLAGAYLAAQAAVAESDYRAADQWFTRAAELDPQNPDIQRGAMIAALSLGDLARAGTLAQRVEALGQADQNTALARAALLAQQKDFAGILALQADGGSLGPLLDALLAGWAHIGLGQMNDGLAQFDTLIATQGLAGFGLHHKAIALALAGDFGGALTALRAPEADFVIQSRRGSLLLAAIVSNLGQNAQAVEFLQAEWGAAGDARVQAVIAQLQGSDAPIALPHISAADSGLAEAFLSVATALGEDSDAAYTLLHAQIARALRPDDAEAVLRTAFLLERQEQFDLAAQTYALIAPTDPDFPSAEVGRADALFAAGRAEESLELLRALAAQLPDDFDVQVALGNGLRRAKDNAGAIIAYDGALALAPNPMPAQWAVYYSRGIAHEQSGDFPRAEADFRQALALNPNQPSVLNYLGYSLVDRGEKLDEALDMIKRAVAARPESGYIVDSLAWAYFRLGRFAEALAPMERASLLEPVDPIVTDHLGDVYWANGRKREARFQWQRALSYEPTEKDAARIRLKLELGLDEVRAREGDPPFPDVNAGGL
jgi:Flp pilus assembly protein TadD